MQGMEPNEFLRTPQYSQQRPQHQQQHQQLIVVILGFGIPYFSFVLVVLAVLAAELEGYWPFAFRWRSSTSQGSRLGEPCLHEHT